MPIYNYDVNAAVKNLVEMTGKVWENQIVGFICAAGGQSSYMSVMAFANSLMLDYRCLIVPRFIYAVYEDFKMGPNGGLTLANAQITQRLKTLARETLNIARIKS